jgi:hypothetical protein
MNHALPPLQRPLRLHRHRRRAQRAGMRGLSGPRRPLGAGAGSGEPGRRRGRHARIRPGLQGIGLRAPAAPDARIHHQGSRAREPRPAAGRRSHADHRDRAGRPPLPIDPDNPSALAARSAADAAEFPATARACDAWPRRCIRCSTPRHRDWGPIPGRIAWRCCASAGAAPAGTRGHARTAAHRRHVRAGSAGRTLRDAAAQGRARVRRGAGDQRRAALTGQRVSAAVPHGGRSAGRHAGAAGGRTGRACRIRWRERRWRPARRFAPAVWCSTFWCATIAPPAWRCSPASRSGATNVISNADPKTTFLQLLGGEHLDTGFVRRIAHLRARGVTAKLHLALNGCRGSPACLTARCPGGCCWRRRWTTSSARSITPSIANSQRRRSLRSRCRPRATQPRARGQARAVGGGAIRAV